MAVTKDIENRTDTAAHWTSSNPILPLAVVGHESDTGKIKYGDGATAWGSLAYLDPTDYPIETNISAAVTRFYNAAQTAVGVPVIGAFTAPITISVSSLSDSNAATAITSCNAQINLLGAYVNKLETLIKNMGACT